MLGDNYIGFNIQISCIYLNFSFINDGGYDLQSANGRGLSAAGLLVYGQGLRLY